MSTTVHYLCTACFCTILAIVSHLEGAERCFVRAGLAQPQLTTNSVYSDFTLEDGIILSHSATDSQIRIATPRQIADFAPGTLDCSITAVAEGSNTVSVLFGNRDDPALTVECDGVWLILPPHRFRDRGRVAQAGTFSTNHLDFSFHLNATGLISGFTAHSDSNIVDVDSALADSSGFRWASLSHLPQNWESVSVLIAGPEAALLDLTLRYTRDRAVMEVH